jgi:hypothetical protein
MMIASTECALGQLNAVSEATYRRRSGDDTYMIPVEGRSRAEARDRPSLSLEVSAYQPSVAQPATVASVVEHAPRL